MRLVLECHRDIACFDEIDVYRLLAGGQREAQREQRYTLLKVPRYAEQIDAAVLRDWGEADVAGPVYAGQLILFMVRDWHDVVVSMHNLPHWLERQALPIMQAKMRDDPGFAADLAREIGIMQASPHGTLATAALYWTYKTRAVLRYQAAGYPVLAVSYEKLVTHPEAELRRVCDFLDLPFDAALLDHTAFAHREVLESGLTVGNTDPKRRISRSSVDQWQAFADIATWDEVGRIVGDLPARVSHLT